MAGRSLLLPGCRRDVCVWGGNGACGSVSAPRASAVPACPLPVVAVPCAVGWVLGRDPSTASAPSPPGGWVLFGSHKRASGRRWPTSRGQGLDAALVTFAGPSRVWGCGHRSQLCPRLREVRRSQRVRRPAGPGPPSGHCKRGHTRFWRGAVGVGRPPLPRLRADTPAPSSPGVCAEGEKFRPPAPEGAGGGAEPLPVFLLGPGFSKPACSSQGGPGLGTDGRGPACGIPGTGTVHRGWRERGHLWSGPQAAPGGGHLPPKVLWSLPDGRAVGGVARPFGA